ncbi:hypothetical protein V3C99_008300 [Haemonchus contortus]|uniref:Na_H_Exchanger domain-containing protein n=1 Tax=Haemonchus contortus TaxID=6289 RepID=A0A7I4YNG2_HAECO|nr:Cation H+ exchanger domain containing protein [Haemonchus contortus]
MFRRSLARSSFGQAVVAVFRNQHVNFLVTCCMILTALYLTIIAIFRRNIFHPFTDTNSTLTEPSADSTTLITSTLSIFFLLVISLCVGKVFQYMSLPPLFGCLLVGLLVKNIVALNEIFDVNPRWEWCLRTLALTVILIRCGISLNWEFLKEKMGVTCALGILTTAVESCSIAVAARFIFEWSVSISIICGLVLAAISPAVTVPVMLDLQSRGLGSRKGIPTIVLASATLDNIFCITAFSIVTTIAFSTNSLFEVVSITVAELVAGIFIGMILGWILWWFPISYVNNSSVCRTFLLATVPSVFVLGGSTLGFLSGGIAATVLMCFIAANRWKTDSDYKIVYEEKAFELLWNLFFMPLLFALIGMKLDFSMMTWPTILTGCALIVIGAMARFLSGIVCSCCSEFNMKEQVVIALSLLPKATVQAALAPAITVYAAGKEGYENEAHMAQISCIITILLTAPVCHYILSKAAPLLLSNAHVVNAANIIQAQNTLNGGHHAIKVINHVEEGDVTAYRIEKDLRF